MAELLDTIRNEVIYRQKYWKSRDDVMDADLLMFLMNDEYQDQKTPGYSKFKTNWMTVAVDRTSQMLIQNPARFRIPLEDSRRDDRDFKTRLERWCRGLWDDIDTRLALTGWTAGSDMVTAKHLLFRGCSAAEIVLKESEQERRGSPTVYHWWDPRFVYPYFDGDGLNSVVYALEARMGDLQLEYQDAPLDSEDADQIVRKYIWYDRDRYAVACDYMPKGRSRTSEREFTWLVPPYEHELANIPVVITAVNQVPVLSVPTTRGGSRRLDPNNSGLTRGPRPSMQTPQTLWARSIFAAVRDAIPQFNEMMALMTQIVRASAYGTWFYLTPDGGPRIVDVGAGTMNWGQLQTKIQRFDPAPIPPGIGETMANLSREIQAGTIPANLLNGQAGFTSGFDRAQAMSVAMNSVAEYQAAHNRQKELVTQEALRQFVGSDYEMTLRGYDARRTPFLMNISGTEIDRFYAIGVQRKPALPDDMVGRIQAARLASDPANPNMDPWTIQDEILESEDPDGIIDKILEWKMMSFPPVLFKTMAEAARRRGVPEDWITSVLDQDTIIQMQQQAAKLQGQGTLAQMQAAGQPTGMSPQAQPPEAGNPMADMMAAQGMGG